jgi:hypothetical protein
MGAIGGRESWSKHMAEPRVSLGRWDAGAIVAQLRPGVARDDDGAAWRGVSGGACVRREQRPGVSMGR